jgi:hypothetical protein
MAYRASSEYSPAFHVLGWAFETRSAGAWIAALALFAAAFLLCRWAWRGARPRWAEVSAAMGEA